MTQVDKRLITRTRLKKLIEMTKVESLIMKAVALIDESQKDLLITEGSIKIEICEEGLTAIKNLNLEEFNSVKHTIKQRCEVVGLSIRFLTAPCAIRLIDPSAKIDDDPTKYQEEFLTNAKSAS